MEIVIHQPHNSLTNVADIGKIRAKMSRLQKLAFGSGDVAINISLMSVSLLLTYFYTDIVGLQPQHIAFLLLIVRVIDAITDPIMGAITDRIISKEGRYRPWIGISAIPFGVSVYLMFTTPAFDYEGKLAWAYGTYILNSLMFTLVTIPYISLIGVITNSPAEKLSANTYRFSLAKTSVLIVTSGLTFLATWLGDGNLAAGFGKAMAIMSALSTAALLFCYAKTSEKVKHTPTSDSEWLQLRLLINNDQWRILATACVLLMTGFLIRSSIAIHYAVYFLDLNSGGLTFALFMSLWAVAGIVATLSSSWLTERYCKIKVFRYSLFLAALTGFVMFFAVGKGEVLLGMSFYFLLCFFSDINTPIFWAAISEVVDYGEKQQGIRVSGLSYGSFSFLQKLGMGLAGFIVGILLDLFGYIAGAQQTPFALTGIALMMSAIPAFLFLAAGLVMNRYIISSRYAEDNLRTI